jgi:chromosome segregation ATPase
MTIDFESIMEDVESLRGALESARDEIEDLEGRVSELEDDLEDSISKESSVEDHAQALLQKYQGGSPSLGDVQKLKGIIEKALVEQFGVSEGTL